MTRAGSPPRVGETQPPAAATPAPTREPIKLGDDGRIHGIDGMLDQVSASLVRQASQDERLHQSVGGAIGRGFAKEAAPWLALGAGALVVIAAVMVSRTLHANAARKRR